MRNAFLSYLKEKIKELGVTLIAEENSRKALHSFQGSVKTLAHEIGIEHRFCDPDSAERVEKGISRHNEWKTPEDKKKADLKGEEIWFEKIADYNGNPIFICGVCHVRSFQLLLTGKGIRVKILTEDFLGRHYSQNVQNNF